MATESAELHPAVACPACKGNLRPAGGELFCENCAISFPVISGVPGLFLPDNQPTFDPALLHLKSRPESARTYFLQREVDSGFLRHPRHFYLLYLLLAITLAARLHWGTAALLLVSLADWLVYRYRRGRILDRFQSNPIVIRCPADLRMVELLYQREGETPPSMADWAHLSWELSGGRMTEEKWRSQSAERYLDILRVYRAQTPPPEETVDVGASDGQAFWEFGIGAGSSLIGIDISCRLLCRFLDRLPGQTALQADGVCLPLKDESVDFLFCTETLERLADPFRAVGEFLRVLRPGGTLVIQSPNAHRLRNLNPFEILLLPWSLLTDRIVRKAVVQENTWYNASTYHWDLSLQDYRRMLRGREARILELYSREFFFPRSLLRGSIRLFRLKERFLRSIPVWKYTGGDLVVVARKAATVRDKIPLRGKMDSAWEPIWLEGAHAGGAPRAGSPAPANLDS